MSLLLLFTSVGGGGGNDETLDSGDLTTALSKWIAGEGFTTNYNTAIRDTLSTEYTRTGQEADLSSMLAKFLRERT